MLDFIYDRPETDFCFCMESQFDLFSNNDTFLTAVKKMGVELPVCKNPKKNVYNEFVIKEPEEMKKYAKPLLSGDMDRTSIILGDLSMPQDVVLSNLEKVEGELVNYLRWAKSKERLKTAKIRIGFKMFRVRKFLGLKSLRLRKICEVRNI